MTTAEYYEPLQAECDALVALLAADEQVAA